MTAEDIASGLRITSLTPFLAESSGDLGYVLETCRTSAGEVTTMLALRRDQNGTWRISAEAIVPRYSGSFTPRWRQAAISVLLSSSAMVIGPTPPGTGVMAPAFG